MCIKEEYRDWHRIDMAAADFQKIVPYLHDAESVVLEGWGESLLHKNLTDFIRLAGQEGCRVGFVTSGWGLDADRARELINAGLDFIGFSLSGATEKTHNAIRTGSDFRELITTMRLFRDLAEDRKPQNLRMHIVYLMLKENIHELPLIVELAKELGVGEVVLINIVQVTSEDQDTRKIFVYEGEEPYRQIIKEATERARKLKVRLIKSSLVAHEVVLCSENPLRNLYISVGGEVSPCVYLYPPVQSPFRRIFHGEECPTEKVSFGNIFKEPFDVIWNRKAYVEFRNAFLDRKRAFDGLYASLFNPGSPEKFELPDAPPPCNTCHKVLGL
jgi:MoaA/NifB/PqqE/SkfB family radical SAM enzyme